MLEKKLHNKHGKPDPKDIEESLLVAIQTNHEHCIPTLIVAGARRLDCALYLAIQLERVKAIAILLLCKATITGDCAVIKSLLSEPPEAKNAPWYMVKVHSILSQGLIKMSYPIAVSIIEKNYEATKELLLRTDLDMRRKHVDWSKLKLTLLHPSWVYSIAPWVVTLKLINNHLRKLPDELFSATQLRRLDLSQNLLETVPANIFALPNLEYLSLAQNRIKEIPETSTWTQSLLSLDLAENLLTTLPNGIQHSSIEILNLSKNQFTSIPKCLCRISTLTSLDLSSTLINSFPPEMQHLDHLVNLNVSNANISDLPGGGGVLRGAVKGVFRARARSSKTSSYIKLILLCNSSRVKSVMLSRLKPHFTNTEPLPEFEQFQWSFRPIFTWKPHKLHFNTWLLGSSYECNSIYPCFYTPGALYVFVWDFTKSADMREQIKVYVDNLVRHIPSANILVISVLPEGYESWVDSNLETSANRLTNFFAKPMYSTLIYHGLMMVVAKQNIKEGQSDIKQQIYDTAANMMINGQLKIGRQYPETYFHLIPVLEKEQQMFQTREKPGVLEENTIWTMFDKALSSDLLHKVELPVMIDFLQESGFLLHYEDPNARLDQYYFTRPHWLYHTLLRVLRHTLQHSKRLELSYNDLCSLVNVNWSKDVCSALIRLMTRYAIILPTRNNQFLVTCLLPHCVPTQTDLNCGTLRRQFAPKSRGLPCDLWVRLICRVLTNLTRITNMSTLQEVETGNVGVEGSGGGAAKAMEVTKEEEKEGTDEETDEKGVKKNKKKAHTLERYTSSPGKSKNNVLITFTKMSETAPPSAPPPHPGPPAVSTEEEPSSPLDLPGRNRDPPSFVKFHISNTNRIEESDEGLSLAQSNGCHSQSGEDGEDEEEPEILGEETELLQLASMDATTKTPTSTSVVTGGSDKVTANTPLGSLKELSPSSTEEEDSSKSEAAKESDGSSSSSSATALADRKHTSAGSLLHHQPKHTRIKKTFSKDDSDADSLQMDGSSASKNRLQRIVSMPNRSRRGSGTSTTPHRLEKGLSVWDGGLIYSRKGVRFTIYPCKCEMSQVEERGIEICSSQDRVGKIVLSRLCRLIQQLLQERYPDMFSVDLLLQKHELTQLTICPVCLESGERNPTSFLVEACVHALLEKSAHNCRYHPQTIPLKDLIPDYLMVDFPARLHLNSSSFAYDETQPLHHGRTTSLCEGKIGSRHVAVKLYQHVDGKTITLPLYYIRQELEMLTTLSHPNIVQTFGYSLQPHPCIFLEKAPMGNLYQKLMDTEQRISRSIRFHIACQVASALNYLHSEDIIYRTLKASSILVWSLCFKEEVNVKLANFERAQLKSPSGLLGKTSFASYPAPEMLRYSFREEYSEKVDIYSFGILLYELVTRWQPFSGIYNTDRIPMSQRPKLSGVNTTGYTTLVSLMKQCWQEDAGQRPAASELIRKLSLPSFQCHIATQVLRDCMSVRDCCYVPSVQQVWVYGEYQKESDYGDGEVVEGTQVFILNSENLTIQGTLEFKERASALFTVDSRVWIGMTEACVHAYDTTTFRFTERFKLSDSVTVIATNDTFIFVAQANGHLSCFPKLAQKDSKVVEVEIGTKAIIAMITVGDILWLSCGNELVILNADDDEVTIEARQVACPPSENVYRLALSKDDTIVWSVVKCSHSITSWDVNTGTKKYETDLYEEFCWICCELNYDPTYLRIVSLECVQDTLWLGLTCGVMVILTATEKPEKITYFRAHCSSPKVIMEVPCQDEGAGHHCPMVLTGGFGEMSSVATSSSEQNGVIMSWHALKAEDCKLVAKRHSKYIHPRTS